MDALASSNNGVGSDRGWSDLGLGVKQVIAGPLDDPSIALAAQVTVPCGAKDFSSHTFDGSAWITGKASWRLLRLTANVGLNNVGKRSRQSPFYGVVVDRFVDSRTDLGVQIYGAGPLSPGGKAELAGGVGFIRQVTEAAAVQVMVGRSFAGLSDLNVYVGATWNIDFRRRAGGGR